ncbi:30S ribosome-binding factor RbfA [Longimicrobium terrae]|uniref:Ribosome-binding factor A n=1 Tax=Longimicrobium terrae TaxID=1639882 RepID=A0A841H7E1_9BACT|nr:30S ribosome-binding factor RbfA [Longimicrobium terrae]MBB4637888.1 ribosome-binding factor A [Longimicrobium terrae]MBB6074017.1 ribosome-binding factor A [Longimicrobium terrae]NNC31178.1 30S ribosome-binding factor RbfA [Longimicrobium terrae]
MPKFRRTDRINEQLKQEISILVRDEVRDPRVGLATITAVQTSPELDHAKVYFTALGEEDERQEILVGLRSASPFIRHELGKRLHMRRIPELHFELDRVLAEAMRIELLLAHARATMGTEETVEGAIPDEDAPDFDLVEGALPVDGDSSAGADRPANGAESDDTDAAIDGDARSSGDSTEAVTDEADTADERRDGTA